MSLSISDNERERWNKKYREALGASASMTPDPFLVRAFSEYVLPLFPHGGRALDLAAGAGRHSIWLARQGWEVTLIDVSESGVEQARQNAGPLASHIHFVVDDLTHFKAAQTQFDAGFELVMAFFYLERGIFSEMLRRCGLADCSSTRLTPRHRRSWRAVRRTQRTCLSRANFYNWRMG